MIPKNIINEDVIKALQEIDCTDLLPKQEAHKFQLKHAGKNYAPKYVLSVANRYRNGAELSPNMSIGGSETNDYLRELGFEVIQVNDFPFECYSWRILSNSLFIKRIDRSAIFHHGSGIPAEIRKYFSVENIAPKEKRNIRLIYNNLEFAAHIELSNDDSPRSRITWKSDLAKIIKEKFEKYINNISKKEMNPEIRFLRVNDNGYQIEFINPFKIEKDAEIELEEYKGSIEGRPKLCHEKRYERDPRNRRAAIEFHGTNCNICNFNFEEFYGQHGSEFIEIHHLNPLYTGEERNVNPQMDLIPVCSNCHRMIHRSQDKLLTPEELRLMISKP